MFFSSLLGKSLISHIKSYHAFADLMFGTGRIGKAYLKHLEQASSQLIDARHSRRLSTPTEFVSPDPPLPSFHFFPPSSPLHIPCLTVPLSFFSFLFSFFSFRSHLISLLRIFSLVPLAAPGEAITIRAPPPCRRTREELARAICSAEERPFSLSTHRTSMQCATRKENGNKIECFERRLNFVGNGTHSCMLRKSALCSHFKRPDQ